MQNTESGRKLNQAMASTGRAVATTGKAVGKFNIYIYTYIYMLDTSSFKILKYVFFTGYKVNNTGSKQYIFRNFKTLIIYIMYVIYLKCV